MRRQRRFADAHGIAYDARGYVRALEDNLRAPLAAECLVELARGSELEPGSTRPPRLLSLYSSAALVLNVFGAWRGLDAQPLVSALGLAAEGRAAGLEFEAPLATGLAGDPPLADVVLRFPAGRVVAIESKFGEWLVRRPRHKRVFKDKYFPADGRVWEAAGLRRCQALAEALQRGDERYRWLNGAQLLKHALGLARAGQSPPSLVYLYFDWAGRESVAHGAELERMRASLGAEVDLRVLRYQDVFATLRASAGVAPDYLRYLEERYFG